MKSNFPKAVGAGVLTLSMAVLPLTLSAQAQTTTDTGGSTSSGTTTYNNDRKDFDWGWLGLIGLAGLAGLGGKKSENQPTAYRDPNAPGATTYRDQTIENSLSCQLFTGKTTDSLIILIYCWF